MGETRVTGAPRSLHIDRISGAVFVVIALLVAWENRAYPLGSLSTPGPGYMPLGLALALGAFGLLVALRGNASPLLNTIGWTESRRAIVLLIGCGVAAFALEPIGYSLTMIALLVLMLGVVERKRPLATLLVTFGFAFISYFIFATQLNVQLPRGPWGL